MSLAIPDHLDGELGSRGELLCEHLAACVDGCRAPPGDGERPLLEVPLTENGYATRAASACRLDDRGARRGGVKVGELIDGSTQAIGLAQQAMAPPGGVGQNLVSGEGE